MSIFSLLEELQLTSRETRTLYSTGTRDVPSLPVYRDRITELVYINDYYVGDEEYKLDTYRTQKFSSFGKPEFDEVRDNLRRVADTAQFYSGKDILDFGCGNGRFLKAVQHQAKSITGIELSSPARELLKASDIKCLQSLDECGEGQFDTCFLWHVFEHLPNPIDCLKDIKRVLKPGGRLLLEVPHARDFLLINLNSEKFKKHTLWSQHLILHTRLSLTSMLATAGFNDIMIKGIQRFPLSNHLNWLIAAAPGGHVGSLSFLSDSDLNCEYEKVLNQIDATDTLIASAVI